MRLTRTFTVVLVAFALLAVTVPAAQARSFAAQPPALESLGGSWLEAAMGWLTRLVGIEPPPVSSRAAAATSNPPPPTGAGYGMGKGAVPMTGSCIDPNGGCAPSHGGI